MTDNEKNIAENDKKKEFLKSYKKSCNKLKSLEEQLKSLRITKESAKLQPISDMPRSNKQADLSDYMVDIEVLETKIIKKENECTRRKIEIENMIADLEDGMESLILHMKYIEFKKWEVICVEIGFEWAQTHRKHSDALHHLKLPD